MLYRSAVASDVLDLISLVQEYCEEENIKYENKSIKNYLDFQLGKLPTIVAVQTRTTEAVTEDKVVGAISWAVVPSPFNYNETIAKKIAYFVSKDYRDQGVGKELLIKAEELVKLSGVKKFYVSSKEPIEGYSTFETEYVKEL